MSLHEEHQRPPDEQARPIPGRDADIADIEDAFPLTPLQQGLLLESLYAPAGGANIEQIVGTLDEALDADAFVAAWSVVVDRHVALRTSVRWSGASEPVQRVHRAATLPVERHDWRGLPAAGQARWHEAYLRADRQRGFALDVPPLMRLALFHLDEARHRFVWSFHHALLDGRSFALVLREVFAIYDAGRAGRSVTLPPVRSYQDVVAWLSRPASTAAEPFWRGLLAGLEAPTPLPGDRQPGRAEAAPDPGRQRLVLSAAETAALARLAERREVTLTTILQAAWAVLLSRFSGEETVCFGATRAGRHGAPGDDPAAPLVGLTIATVPVVARVAPAATVADLLRALRADWVAMRPYEHTPLVQIQAWSEVASPTPLFESLLMVEHRSLEAAPRAGDPVWSGRGFELLEQPGYPLALAAHGGERLDCCLSHDRRRVDDATVARLLASLRTLLAAMAADEHARLADLPLLPVAERRRLLDEWSNAGADAGLPPPFLALVERQVAERPDHVAVRLGETALTYRELDRRATELAHALRRRGVGPEVVVGVCLDRSPRLPVALLGILRAGGAYLPLDPRYPTERLARMLDETRAPVLLTEQALLPSLPPYTGQTICLDTDRPEIAPDSPPLSTQHSALSTNSLAYIIYTSGSTGQPKGVLLTQRGLAHLAAAQRQWFDLGPADRVLQFSSPCFDASVFEMTLALQAGATLCLVGRDDLLPGPPLLDTLRRERITLVTLPPSALAELPVADLPDLRRLAVAGEACPAELVARWAGGRAMDNLYGPTEATVWATAAACRPDGQAPPIGRPVGATEVYVLDESRRPVPVGVAGELYLGGPALARGYLNRPELTDERFIAHPFAATSGARLYRTGDRARFRADGALEFLGRADRQLKVRGFRVEPGEIEAALLAHPAVRQAVVTAQPDPTGQLRLIAYLTPAGGAAPGSTAEVREWVRRRLPEHMLPAGWVWLDRLPTLPSGKLDRCAVPAPAVWADAATAERAPSTPVEARIAAIWAELLGRERVGVEEDFFEAGGHSLLAARLIARLRDAFGCPLPIRAIFETPTVAGLARRIEAALPPLAPAGDAWDEGEI